MVPSPYFLPSIEHLQFIIVSWPGHHDRAARRAGMTSFFNSLAITKGNSGSNDVTAGDGGGSPPDLIPGAALVYAEARSPRR
jgi:hypothetical protein